MPRFELLSGRAASDPHVDQPQLSRRDVIRGTAASAAAVCTPLLHTISRAEAAEKADILQLDVDCHSHIWTPDIKKYPLKEGTTKKDLTPPSFTTEQLLAIARRNGVGRVVLIQHHLFYGWDNSYIIDAAREHPGVFAVVGMVDDRCKNPDDQMRRLLKQRVTGFRITSWIHGKEKWLEGPGMAAMWRCAAETRQNMCCLIDPHDLPAVTGMCRKFPDTPVVIDHFARIGIDGKIRDHHVKQLCALAKFKNTRVKVSAFYALGKKQPPYTDLVPMIRRLYEAFGAKRLMWGSDSPYQLEGGNTYEASIDLVRKRLDFLSDSDRQWLLRRTAEETFFRQLG